MDQINVLVHKLVDESFSLRATNISQNISLNSIRILLGDFQLKTILKIHNSEVYMEFDFE